MSGHNRFIAEYQDTHIFPASFPPWRFLCGWRRRSLWCSNSSAALVCRCHNYLVYLKCCFVLMKVLPFFPAFIYSMDLLCMTTVHLFALDGVWGTSSDTLPLRKRLQWWPSPAISTAAAGEDPPQEQEAQSTPGSCGHTQAEGGAACPF